MPAPARLRMFAGPNGAGKTTLVKSLSVEHSDRGLFRLHTFVNADDVLLRVRSKRGLRFSDYGVTARTSALERSIRAGGRLPDDHPFLQALGTDDSVIADSQGRCDAYAAAAVADFMRDELLSAGRSFSFETVMSHRSKVDFLARSPDAGYRTYLYYIATESAQVNIHRVETRLESGGHDVPVDKITSRYERSLRLLKEALQYASRAFLFDNSGAEPLWIAEAESGGEFELKVAGQSLPKWFKLHANPYTD